MGKVPTLRDFRDVSGGLRKLRDFLLGRKSVNPHRFPPLISPRSIPPPEVPRGPEYKYSDQYYCYRDVLNSVKPPVVAPVAAGPTRCFPSGGSKLQFPSELPTPGCVWWFDAHCYYKEVNYRAPRGPPPSGPPAAKPAEPCTLEAKQDTQLKLDVCDPCDPCGKEKKK